MSVALVTGSAGLVGSEAATYFANRGLHIVGIDNDMRQQFFGAEATTRPNLDRLKQHVPSYEHHDADIRDQAAMQRLFMRYGREIALVIHTAAQPSHDWAASAPLVDFSVNATGTLLEAIAMTQAITGRELRWTYHPEARTGDHRWWISDMLRFQSHYPDWRLYYDISTILSEIAETYAEQRTPLSRLAA